MTCPYYGIDFRKEPHRYKIGRGERGVLLAEPYKSEILPYWRFKTPEIAKKSSRDILNLYEQYKSAKDFIGMDMCRKYLQMGWTRSKRYANHKTGQKYIGPVPDDKKGQSGAHGRDVAPYEYDPIKDECSKIFYQVYMQVKNDPDYQNSHKEWKKVEAKNNE